MRDIRSSQCSTFARLAAGAAMALAVAACGGGGSGGGGPGLVVTPPPVTPPPPQLPPPPPEAAPVFATSGGPNFTSGPAPGTVFPLLQVAVVADEDGFAIDPGATTGTATVEGGVLQVNTRHSHPGETGTYGMVGEADFSGYEELDWMRVGYWSSGGLWDYVEGGSVRHRGVFVTGYETSPSAVPTTGTASYNGHVQGSVFLPAAGSSGALPCACSEVPLTGVAAFTADFGARSVNGTLTGMWAGGDPWNDDPLAGPWNDVAFSSVISGNRFVGDTWVTSAPGGAYSLSGSATGTIEGIFFGPTAQEAGAVWTLSDGSRAAIGTIAGTRH